MQGLVVALLCAGWKDAAPQFPSSPVTFSCRAGTADHVLAALSTVAGVKLQTTEETAREVLLISVNHVSLNEVMTRVATAASAEWRTVPGGFRLVPAESTRRKEEDQAVTVRTAAVRKAIQTGMTPPKKAAENKSNAEITGALGGAFGGGGPEAHHVFEVLNATDPAAIAVLQPGERIVFSTQPTQMQRPFSDDISTALTAIVTEHNAGIAKNPNPVGEETGALGDQTPAYFKNILERTTKPVGQVAKTLLIVSRMALGGFGSMTAELRMYDPAGKLAFSGSVSIEVPWTGMNELMQVAKVFTGGAKPATDAKATPVDVSPDTKAIGSAMSGFATGGGKPMNLSEDVKAKIYRPDVYDPLSFMPTDEILSLAKKQGRPVVADLSDGMVSVAEQVMPTQTATVEAFEKRLADGSPCRIVTDPTFLVIMPGDPPDSREHRLDRRALAGLLHATLEKGVASLDDISTYALHGPSPMDGGIGASYILFFVPGAFAQGFSGLTSWEMLRIYGALDAPRRETLAQGGRLALTSLTAYQAEQVRKMAYGAMPMLTVEDPSHKTGDAAPGFLQAFLGGPFGDYRDEATEVLPNGIPGDGFLTMKTSTEPFAVPVANTPSGGSGPASILDAETLATYKMMRESPNFAAMSSMFTTPDKGRVGQRTVYAFTFQLAPKVTMATDLNDNRFDGSSPIISLATLPSDFQKVVDERLASLKSSPFGAMAAMSMMGGQSGIKP